MYSATTHLKVKTVGKKGQVYIGKRYVGRKVLVDTSDPDIIKIRIAAADDEGVLPQPEATASPTSVKEQATTTSSITDNAN